MCLVNVFIPQNILLSDSGFLSGKYYTGDYDLGKEPLSLIIDDKVEKKAQNDSIGIISKHFTRGQKKSPWIVVETKPTFLISSITIEGKSIKQEDVNVIFYNSAEVKGSCLLCQYNDGGKFSKSIDFFIQRVKGERTDYSSFENTSENKGFQYIFNIWIVINKMLYFSLISLDKLLKKFSITSCSVEQLLHRLNQIEEFQTNFKLRKSLVVLRIAGVIFVDILLGFLSFYLLYTWTSASKLNLAFQIATKIVAGNVQDLLSWLRGAPAGLKLNQPLTEALASFFSYHVYLWTLYLKVANPVLAVMTHLFVFVGLLGVSIQIGLLVDFLNLAVLHIHCFYIYAARLHMIQVSLLGSQWRSFRGRKWNPLKQRVDAQTESGQRPLKKIVSAVGFTLVLFLLPTTSVYYAVFVTLRLCMMTLHGVVSTVLWAINFNPIFVVLLHVFRSPLLKGEMRFEMREHWSENRPIELDLSIEASPLRESIAASHLGLGIPPIPKPNLGYISSSLIYARDLL